jgi:agmatine deiminase
MLVRDAADESQARALLQRRRIDADPIQFVHDERAPYFVRDAAVFGLDGDGRPFIVDFKWTYYGWTSWCRRIFRGNSRRNEECGRVAGPGAGNLDQWLADRLGMPSFRSHLAAEGGGVEVNGQGVLIANTSLWQSRNPELSQAKIEAELLRLPGIRKVIWLPHGLAHDPLHRGTITGPYVGWGTGGHTDEFVRFADARTVLLASVDEAEARRHPVARLNRFRMRMNFDVLKASTDQNGQALRVVQVPLPNVMERPVVLASHADTSFSEQWTAASFPDRERRRNGETVQQVATSSYLNYVVANKVVLVPDYVPHGTPAARQAQVQQIFEAAFPGRRIQFVDAGHTNWFGGGAHCATLNQPLSKA